jgi:phosphate transport system protein
MPRELYQAELQDLNRQVLLLGARVDDAVGRAMQSLQMHDAALARAVIAADCQVNDNRFRIEEAAIRLIATQQPVAADLRAIVAILNVIVELERIGDYAAGIAKITLLYGEHPLLAAARFLVPMAERGQGMLRRALGAFAAVDTAAAEEIAGEDDAVDALHEQTYRALLAEMLGDPQVVDRATWLLWVSHDLERIADRVTNICERVIYKATGVLVEINVSTY